MKTINSKIDYFTSRKEAVAAFDKVESGHLLEWRSANGAPAFFVDKSKKALSDWPNRYTLIKEK